VGGNTGSVLFAQNEFPDSALTLSAHIVKGKNVLKFVQAVPLAILVPEIT